MIRRQSALGPPHIHGELIKLGFAVDLPCYITRLRWPRRDSEIGGQHSFPRRCLFQKYVDRRVGNAQFLTGMDLVAAVAGRGPAGRCHADNRLRRGERTRSLVRFGVEQKPRNGLVDRRRGVLCWPQSLLMRVRAEELSPTS